LPGQGGRKIVAPVWTLYLSMSEFDLSTNPLSPGGNFIATQLNFLRIPETWAPQSLST
jgi:hypothetical protein